MVYNLFLDTNVILDVFLKRHGFSDSVQILKFSEEGRLNIFISETVLVNTIYILEDSMSRTEIRKVCLQLLILAEILPFSQKIAVDAIHSQFSDIEDAILYYLALSSDKRIDFFITSNLTDFKIHALKMLPVLSPSEFMKKYGTEFSATPG